MSGLFAPPVGTGAEQKIVAECARIKAVSPTTDCYMYPESDWARTWFYTGSEFDAHPRWELHLDARPGSPLQNTTETQVDDAGVTHTWYFNAYDFSVPEAQAAWVTRVAGWFSNSSGALNGAFIDGNRGGWGSGVLSGTTPAHAAAWSKGLASAHGALAAALGPDATMISNYFTPEAETVCSGGMIERGGSGLGDVQNLMYYANRTCGARGLPCLVDYHAQYADVVHSATYNSTLATFLVGMGKYAYYGRGGGWGGNGASACASWLERPPEFEKPLGEPKGVAAEVRAGVFTREFASGTRVYVDTSKGGGHCIWWGDGSTTGNLANCPAKI